ncbi:MAG: S46 family peptidase [Bacteroidetes bacterium]|nr:S46 family peptidase [Bacteroidota bacterium]
MQYAAKFRTLENYYKKWKGEILGLKKFNVGQVKTDYESAMTKSNPAIRPILDSLSFYNEQYKPLAFVSDYYTEALSAVELLGLAGQYKNLVALCNSDTIPDSLITAEINKIKSGLKGAYRNYSLTTDKSVAHSLIAMSLVKLKKENLPLDLKQFSYDHSGVTSYIEKMYSKSIFRDSVSASDFLSHFSRRKVKKLKNDPAYRLYAELNLLTIDLQNSIDRLTSSLNRFQRMYFAELRKTDSSRRFYPDANSTLRLSYGQIQSMSPADGKIYNWFTTADGLLAKFDNSNPDFKMPEKMVSLLKAKDYGRFAIKGVLPVAFISSLHTTGGNSGSPVLDAKGQLVGINYDRVWEGIMSDLYYDVTYCRNIALDVRYFLFVIEKYGNATRLTDEMTIVGN